MTCAISESIILIVFMIRVYNIDSVHDHVDTINDFLNTSVHVYMHKYIRKIQLKIFIEK